MSERSEQEELEHQRLLALKRRKIEMLEARTQEVDMLPHLYLHKQYPWEKEFFEDYKTRKQVVVCPNQVGKAVLNQELTARHSSKGVEFCQVKDIKIGDYLYARDGTPTKVLDIPWEGEDECYEVAFDDGSSMKFTQSHLFWCKGEKERFPYRSTSKGKLRLEPRDYILLTLKQMYEYGKYYKDNKPVHRIIIPYCEPVQYPHKKLFDPYALGLILGDGHVPSSEAQLINVYKPDEFILSYLAEHLGADIRVYDSKPNCPVAVFRADIDSELRGKKSWEKFIPEDYMTASFEQRLALLRGLMDTDGTTTRDSGSITEFNSTSQKLAQGVRELVFSLGGTSKISTRIPKYTSNGEVKEGRMDYRVRIKMPPYLNPFSSPAKAKYWRGDIRYKHERVIYSIKPVGKHSGRCFTVDSEDSTFIAGKNYVVSHNSSALIKKIIHVATSPEMWPMMWPELPRGMLPSQWWHLYPTDRVASIEFDEKWRPILPKYNEDHPRYGWQVQKTRNGIESLHFNTGINLYFKFYSQSAQALQSGSCYFMGLDEECPVALLPELQMRVNATRGFMNFVFTATLGQKFWKDVVEHRNIWKDARVWQVSLTQCTKYADGSPSPWTRERIKQTIADCISQEEVDRRVHGKIIAPNQGGRQYPTFNRMEHVRPYEKVPDGWVCFAGVDYGSGNPPKGHPSAITIIAVNSKFTLCKVVRHWRGDGQVTTAEDVVDKYEHLAKGLSIMTAFYDFSTKDVGTIATRRGLPFNNADKRRESGKQFVNTLFKRNALEILVLDEDFPTSEITADELQTGKLMMELENLVDGVNKSAAKDDSIDSLRYAIHAVPWDWDLIKVRAGDHLNKINEERKRPKDTRQENLESFRRKSLGKEQQDSYQQEINEWVSLMDG